VSTSGASAVVTSPVVTAASQNAAAPTSAVAVTPQPVAPRFLVSLLVEPDYYQTISWFR